MQPNEPDQPHPTQPEFGPWGPNPTRLNPNLDAGAPTWPEIGFKLGSFGFIKYIIGLNPNLNPFWGQPDPIGPVYWPWGSTRPDSTRILGPKLGSTRKNGSGLAALFNSNRNRQIVSPYQNSISNVVIPGRFLGTEISSQQFSYFAAPPFSKKWHNQ